MNSKQSPRSFLRCVLTLLVLVTLSVGCVHGQVDDPALDAWRNASVSDKTAIVDLARLAFNTYVLQHRVIDPPDTISPLMQSHVAVFVSTMRHGAPRTCMGTLYPTEPDAADEIIQAAVAGAGYDRRFAAVKPSDLKDLTLIVSVVSSPRSITKDQLSALDPERDGLVVRNSDSYGVVLSGETDSVARMVQWGKIRAHAGASSVVSYYRIDDVRYVEGLIQ